jgi:beta-lactamase superfamily II metal-dependent hydrolase
MNKEVNLYFLNVGEGDSVVIEVLSNTNRYIVIDSNRIRKGSQFINPAYEFLKSKNTERISALIITHLHHDHYNGIELFLNNFDIDKLVIPPFLSSKSSIFNQIIASYRKKIEELLDRCSEDEVFLSTESLASLIRYLTNNDHKIEEAMGKESLLRFPGVEGIEAFVYLPLKKVRGVLHRLIASDDFEIDSFPKMNDSSVVICLRHHGYNILLTSDSTLAQWREHERQMRRDKITNLNSHCLKAPHHGSKYNNDERLYKYLLTEDATQRYIFVSANGITHPDKEVFDLINQFGLIPYCTNLSPLCISPKIYLFEPLPHMPREMHPFLVSYVQKKPVPCQGDIILNINAQGIDIKNSTGALCIYRQ